ncbi:MAG: class I SAM-dependent methyltransferase [Archaeoglobi archaeon]|nr:class I SAM-dependent methyltransferase [Archaeoglobi archaeon]
MDAYRDATLKEYLRAYWNGLSSRYEKMRCARSDEERRAWASLMTNILGEDRKRVLDVGTGTGFLARILAEIGHEATGVDISERMIEVARKISANEGLNIEFEVGDAERLDFEDERFDAVVCRYVLWTLPNPWRAVREWVRVTRPGGRVVVVDGVWCDSSLSSRLRSALGRLGMLVHERCNPFRGYEERVSMSIPFINGVEPEIVVEIMRECGLRDVRFQWLDGVRRLWLANLPPLFKIAWNRPIYVVYGIKP